MKKYKLGPKETFSKGGTYLRAHRITALIDIPAHNVKAGDLGGWVGSRWNLSHAGDCWIGENAVAGDGSRVSDDALITGNAALLYDCKISGNAVIKDDVVLAGKVIVKDKAVISGKVLIEAPEYYDGESGYIISDSAQIMGSAQIDGRGYVKGAAIIKGLPKIEYLRMSGNTVIAGNPTIHNCELADSAQIFDSAAVWTTILKGKSKVYGQATISKGEHYTQLSDDARVFGNAQIYGSYSEPATSLSGNASVYDNATVKEGCHISDTSVINEYAHILEGCHISGNSKVSGPDPLPARYRGKNLIQDRSGIKEVGRPSQPLSTRSTLNNKANYIGAYSSSPISAALRKQTPTAQVAKAEPVKPASKAIEPIRRELAEIVANVERDYDLYKNDVVKLIKYPAMVDPKEELTLNFTFALRKAKRELSYGENVEKMEESVENLEKAFLAAESNAQKIGPSNYTEQEVKKTETAKQMFAVALDAEASENERRVSFKQAFKILEGIIAVPDSAVENMKVQVGLKELEA